MIDPTQCRAEKSELQAAAQRARESELYPLGHLASGRVALAMGDCGGVYALSKDVRCCLGNSIDEALETLNADIVVALRSAGTPLPTNDIWIAAVCAREGATVLSYDAHFAAIGRVGSKILSRD